MGLKISCLGNYRKVWCENPPKFSPLATEQKEGFSCTGWTVNEETLMIRNQQPFSACIAFIKNTLFLISLAWLIFHQVYLKFSSCSVQCSIRAAWESCNSVCFFNIYPKLPAPLLSPLYKLVSISLIQNNPFDQSSAPSFHSLCLWLIPNVA